MDDGTSGQNIVLIVIDTKCMGIISEYGQVLTLNLEVFARMIQYFRIQLRLLLAATSYVLLSTVAYLVSRGVEDSMISFTVRGVTPKGPLKDLTETSKF